MMRLVTLYVHALQGEHTVESTMQAVLIKHYLDHAAEQAYGLYISFAAGLGMPIRQDLLTNGLRVEPILRIF